MGMDVFMHSVRSDARVGICLQYPCVHMCTDIFASRSNNSCYYEVQLLLPICWQIRALFHIKKEKSTSELFPNQFPHFANIPTTVNSLQRCHLQNFPISRKPVPPSPIVTGDSLQISCGQTACDVLAKICALCVCVCVCGIFVNLCMSWHRLPIAAGGRELPQQWHVSKYPSNF